MARILGIDYGVRRVGYAVSDYSGILATPLRTVEVSGIDNAVVNSLEISLEVEAESIVVGLPLNMDGSRGEMVDKVDKFIAKLTAVTDLPISTWDERLSSSMVERTLLEADMSRGKRKKVIDKLAAQVILQGYLDSLCQPDAMDLMDDTF